MAIMWVGGKPVEVSPEEAVLFAPVADAAPPGVMPNSAMDRVIKPKPFGSERSGASRLSGLYAELDEDGQEILAKMLAAHPRQLAAADLKHSGDSRRLAKAMSAITKRAGGKNRVLSRRMEWESGQRIIRYKLTDEMVRIGKEEKWGDNR